MPEPIAIAINIDNLLASAKLTTCGSESFGLVVVEVVLVLLLVALLVLLELVVLELELTVLVVIDPVVLELELTVRVVVELEVTVHVVLEMLVVVVSVIEVGNKHGHSLHPAFGDVSHVPVPSPT